MVPNQSPGITFPGIPSGGNYGYAPTTDTLTYDGPSHIGTAMSTWTPLPLINGWKAMSGAVVPSYRLEGNGVVRLKGVVDSSSAGGSTQFANLPAAIIPSTGGAFGVPLVSSLYAGGSYGQAIVFITGINATIIGSAVPTNPGWLLLDGLTYTLS